MRQKINLLIDLSKKFTTQTLTFSFSVTLFSFIWLFCWQPATAQTPLASPASEFTSIENKLMSPRLARDIQSGGITVRDENAGQSAPQNRAPSADGDIDASFNANVTEGSGFVEEAIAQPDGKIIIGGSFSAVNGQPRRHLARINTDGSLDATFNPGGAGPNAMVRALALQPDGKILIGGNGAEYNGVFRGTITRLNADGTPDASFNGSGTSAGGIVEAIAVQPDGKILIGGSFSDFNGVPRSQIARLNEDGTLDTSFNPGSGFNNLVLTIVPQPDGRILVGGTFTQYNGATVGRIVRLNADGSLDATFNAGGAGANSSVESIVLQPDGKILIGGFFSAFNATPTLGIVRLSANGALDTAINIPGFVSGTVTAIALQPDGKILVGGAFTDGTAVNRGLARFNADGSLDFSFVPGATNDNIFSLVVLPDGKILIGGSFTQYNGAEHRRLVRLNSTGGVDNTFNVSVNTAGIVYRIIPQADGKILIAGDFESVNGAARRNIVRLNADGSLDTTFNVGSGANTAILALAMQTDGKILIGGNLLTDYNGATVNNFARLNADGSLDTTFNLARTPLFVSDIKLQQDGRILIGGFFIGTSGVTGIVRVNSNGSSDTTFNAAAITNSVQTIALQPDGKILVGGIFTTTTGSSRIARLNSNGTLDTSFLSPLQTSGTVEVIAVLPDARILVGGTFSMQVPGSPTVVRNLVRLSSNGNYDPTFNPPPPSGFGGISGTVRALFVQPDGKILIGGFFSSFNGVPANRIVRLNPNGNMDSTFTASADNVVEDIALQTDGKILVGGEFTTFNGAPRRSLVRLQGSPALATRRTKFDFDGDGRADLSVFRPENGVWYLLNSQSGFTGVAFGQTTDRIVPADYDGDGVTDIAVYRNGTWYLQRSTQGFTGVTFGDGSDIPQPADYDGDGKAELAVFRPSNGNWYVLNLAGNQVNTFQFGQTGDKPVAADYDGDGKADYAVFRSGTWYIQRSQLGFTGVAFGEVMDKPVAADYDGDGKADVAVFRPPNGTWYLQRSSAGFTGVQFGVETDLPVPADYDGDGKSDVAVFRQGTWYLQRSTQGFAGISFGAATDRPAPNAFIP